MSRLATLFEPPDDATPDELRARLRALADLIARAPVPIAVAHDADCQLISANDALARLLGVPSHANISLTPPVGEAPLIASSATDATFRRGAADAICRRASDARHQRYRDRPSRWRVVYVQNDVEPLYDRHGTVCGCVSVCVDMTSAKRRRRCAARCRPTQGRIPGDVVP